jgi:hypothetical protein
MMPVGQLEQAVTFLIGKYKDDIIMLDALNQWAMNPTSASAGYEIERNYDYIHKNLKERYPRANLEEVMQKLREECAKLTLGYDVYECRKKIKEIIDKTSGEKLRNYVVERVNKLSIDQKKILYICLKLSEKIRQWFFMRVPEEILNVTSRFHAAGIVTTVQDSLLIPVKTGFFDELLWVSSGTSPPQSEYCIPKFIEPLLEKIDGRIKEDIPDLPNAKEYVKSLKDMEKFEQLRLLDELANVGASNELAIRKLVVANGVIGRYQDFVAISPLIHDDLKRSLEEEKARLVQLFKPELEEVLLKIRNERFPEVELTENALDEDIGWIMEAEGASPLYILLMSWILRRHRQLLKEQNSYAIIITNQSLPSVCETLATLKGRNLTVLCKFGNKFFLRGFGGHKMLEEILQKLRQKGYEIQERETLASKTIEELGMVPEKPFTNLTQVFELMRSLNGPILLLDKHFDEEGFKFLRKLDPILVNNVKILMGEAHLSRDFRSIFRAFKDEMATDGIIIELRIVDEKDAIEVHDRYLMSRDVSYNTPPWNVVYKKLGDVKRIRDTELKRKYFEEYWSRATML